MNAELKLTVQSNLTYMLLPFLPLPALDKKIQSLSFFFE